MKRIFSQYKIWFICAVSLVILSLLKDQFHSIENIRGLLYTMTPYGVTALGLTISLITGLINISLGSVMAFCACVFCLICDPFGFWLALIVTIFAGTLIGFMHGYLVAYVKLSTWLVGVSIMLSFKGLALYITNSAPVRTYLDETFLAIANAKIGNLIPATFFVLLFLAVLAAVVLKYTRFGRNFYAVGSNNEAAAAAGINVSLYKCLSLTCTGLMASLGSILAVTRLYSANGSMFSDCTVSILPMVVIGGTSVKGGKGSTIGTLAGCLFMSLITNSMYMFNLNVNVQTLLQGVILIAVVAVEKYFINKDIKI